jgi:hypothetical protein
VDIHFDSISNAAEVHALRGEIELALGRLGSGDVNREHLAASLVEQLEPVAQARGIALSCSAARARS